MPMFKSNVGSFEIGEEFLRTPTFLEGRGWGTFLDTIVEEMSRIGVSYERNIL